MLRLSDNFFVTAAVSLIVAFALYVGFMWP